MNVYRIYILIIDLFFTPLLMIDKKGENDFEFIYAYFLFEFMFIQKREEKDFESLYKKGEKVFWEKNP